MSNFDFKVYQIYYDKLSKDKLDKGFIPFNNTGGKCHNFENDVIKSVYINKRKEWVNADYVGVLSWRFYEKTKIKSMRLYEEVAKSGYPVVSIMPNGGYRTHPHPFSNRFHPEILNMCKIADENKLFDFNLLNYKVDKKVWCNYWVASPEVFDLYCTKYLLKSMAFFSENKDKVVKEAYESKMSHRGKQTLTFTFFLEGMFSIFLQEEQISHYKIII